MNRFGGLGKSSGDESEAAEDADEEGREACGSKIDPFGTVVSV